MAYIGARSAGHFVKTVHNGIEYTLMQLISETYEVMKNGLQMDDKEIHAVFEEWNDDRFQSYLIEITRDIFAYKKSGEKYLFLDDSIHNNLIMSTDGIRSVVSDVAKHGISVPA